MENLSFLAKAVLQRLEPDPERWQDWLEQKPIYPVSQCEEMLQFVDRMQIAKQQSEKVFVAGDYDCDGILATTIMVSGLRSYGIECGFYIPDRIQEGYGLNEDMVMAAHKKGYGILITVDNGVKAQPALELAQSLGMETIVSDHHMIDEEVDCEILLHPTTLESYFSTLCGAGIAYECIRALGVDTKYHLELACVASVGDVMIVTGETRSLIQQGLRALNEEKERHIIKFVTDTYLNEVSLGFQVAPKLNAIGRLSNMANVNNVVRYFLSEDEDEINHVSAQIKEINERRKHMSSQMCEYARMKVRPRDEIILICEPNFHEGIIGLVAGDIQSQTNKPVIIGARNQNGYKMSMRSPKGFHCMEFLKPFDKFQGVGGHAQAAGFSMDLDAYRDFETFIHRRMQEYHWKPETIETIEIDPSQINVQEIESLDVLRPFGPGFECPSFEIKHPNIKSFFDIQNRKHRRYTLQEGLTCMRFNQPMTEISKSVNSIESFIGKLQINQYQGRKQANFIIDEIVYK